MRRCHCRWPTLTADPEFAGWGPTVLANNLSLRQLAELRGRPVFARSGERIGKLSAVLYDDDSGRAGWIGIRRGLWRRPRLAPAGGAALRESGIRLPYSAALVDAAPRHHRGDPEATRIALYRHYHLSYPGQSYPAALPQAPAPLDNELPAGAIRLRRWLESKERPLRVPVEREVLVMTRQPIFEPVDEVELGAQSVELVLTDVESVVSTRVVAKERVLLRSTHEPAWAEVRGSPSPAPGPVANGTGREHHGDRQTV